MTASPAGALTGAGVTVFMTTEVAKSFTELRFSVDLISFLTDDLIVQRYVETEGEFRKVMTVIKMRGGNHSKELRLFDVTTDAWWSAQRSTPTAALSWAQPNATSSQRPYPVDFTALDVIRDGLVLASAPPLRHSMLSQSHRRLRLHASNRQHSVQSKFDWSCM